MKTIRICMATMAIISIAIFGCSKADLSSPKPSAETVSFSSEAVSGDHICGEPVVYTLLDTKKAPQGTITVSNDETNVYITFTSTNADLKFQKTTLVVGDLAHVSAATNSTAWPKIGTGPNPPDYSMTFKPEVSSYTFTIPAANYDDCFLINAFGRMVQRDPVTNKIIAATFVFLDSKTEVSTKCWSAYVQYCKQDCPPPCGQLTTYTQGGYGNDRGNGAGTSYMIANFAAAFPGGITIGDAAGYTLTMTNANSIALYLPTGSTPSALTQNWVDAGPDNILAGQILTLSLSVGFDNYDANFGAGQNHLADMIIGSGPFQGKTVAEFLSIANQVLGGTSNAYTAADVNSTADSINNNYDNGTQDLGFLTCPN